MKKKLLVIFVALLGATLAFADDANKIPLDLANTILKIQLDESDIKNQMIQLQAQYNSDQQRIQHDEDEITATKTRALEAAKKDPKEWDVDSAKLEFVGKAKAAPAPAPTAKTK